MSLLSSPSLFWTYTLQCHYGTAGWRGRLGCTTSEVGRWEEGVVTGGRTSRWVCVCLCMCETSWEVLLLANLAIHQTVSIHRPLHSLYLQPLCSPPTQGPSMWLSAKPGISTLISHLWRPNELRLLLHLWDPTDYQTGGNHLSMARGGIYTVDLAAKERGNKMVEKTEE